MRKALSRDTPRRVFHLLESGGIYGAENVVLNLSREMAKTPDYTPVVGCIVQDAQDSVALFDKACELGIEAHKIVINNRRFPLDIPRFLWWLKANRIDLVHAHGYKASILGFFANLFLRKPFLPTCHLWFWSESSPLKYRLMTALEMFLYRFVPVVTVVSQPIKEVLAEKGISPERVTIIRNGVNLDDFPDRKSDGDEDLRRELGLEAGVPLVLNLGRLTEQKAQGDIIKASRILKDKGHKVQFLILGDGELQEELTRQIEALGVENEVRLLGFRADAHRFLQMVDLFLLPSLDEGLPMALLEAMASKVPVLATAVGDIPELFAEGSAGVILPKAAPHKICEELLSLLENPDRMGHLKDAGYAQIKEKYSSDSMFCSYKPLYEEKFKS